MRQTFERTLGRWHRPTDMWTFSHHIADTTGRAITPESLRTDVDIESFARALRPEYSDKSIANYRSVMRRYVKMVDARGL